MIFVFAFFQRRKGQSFFKVDQRVASEKPPNRFGKISERKEFAGAVDF